MRRKRRTKQELPPIICGIYFFEVVSGNPQKIGWKYIGQSEDIYERKDKHLSALKGKYHKNQKLKNYFNKYGEDSLKHGILFECEEKDLDFWEIFFIACFNSYKKQGFNLTEGGDGKSFLYKPVKLKNMETGEIVEYNSIEGFAKKYDLNKGIVGQVMNGKSKYVGEWFNPEKKWRPKQHQLKGPDENIYTFCGVKRFCEKHKLNEKCIFPILSGENINHQGWTLPNPRDRIEPYSNEYSFISPDGQIFKGKNIRKFALEQGIIPQSLQQLHSGKFSSLHGWRKYMDGDKIEKFIFNEYKFISPNGELVVVNNMRKFALENNLEEKNLHKVFKKERSHHKGWRKYEDGTKLSPFIFKEKYKFISPTGEIKEVGEIKSFATIYGLNAACLYRVSRGKDKSHHGWTKYKETN